MIDHLLRFASGAAAQTDAVVSAYYINGNWRGDVCLPNVQVWQPSADTQSTDGHGNKIITHSYLPYWHIMISLPTLDQALRNHPACTIVADRDAANAGKPFILYTSIVAPDSLANYDLSPTFAGSGYPFGAVNA